MAEDWQGAKPEPAMGDGTGQLDDTRRLRELQGRLAARARIVAALRSFFDTAGFLAVETPLRVPAPAPEQHIDCERSGDRFLLASPELQMKRLLLSGIPRLYQVGHAFRAGERGSRHLPEFTIVEWYRAEATSEALIDDCERLLLHLAQTLGWGRRLSYAGRSLDLTPPWPRMTIDEAFLRAAGWAPGADPDPGRFSRDLVELVEPALPGDRPCFLVDWPASQASLARLRPGDPAHADRFELYAGGLELANGFGELLDADEQRRRFEIDRELRRQAGRDVAPLDERFLAALGAGGLTAAAGIALGLDRLVMLLTDARTIDEVVAFPEGTQ